MADYRKLDVWKLGHALAIETHRVAQKLRGAQYVSLRSQIIRAALSIPANIVEGSEQSTRKEFVRFLRYSIGSASELEYHLTFAHDIGALPKNDYELLAEQVARVRRMLHGLIGHMKRD